MTIASLNSLRLFWRRAVRPPLVITALLPWSMWKRRSLVVVAPAIEQGLPGDMAVGPSELSSGRGGRSTEEEKITRHYFKFSNKTLVIIANLTYPCHPWWWPEQLDHKGRPLHTHWGVHSRLLGLEALRLQRSEGCHLLYEPHLLYRLPVRDEKDTFYCRGTMNRY